MENSAPKEKITLFWSSGKESLLALCALGRHESFEVSSLLTTVNFSGRVYLHGIPGELLKKQAKSLGLPLKTLPLASLPTSDEQERTLRQALMQYKQEGINHVAFGDVSNIKIKTHREKLLASFGMKAIFPLWEKKSHELVRAFIDLGFKAVATCVDPKVLNRSFAGRSIDNDFLKDLPKGISPCGENGEFHAFVHDGPIFSEPVTFKKNTVVLRDNLYFCELSAFG